MFQRAVLISILAVTPMLVDWTYKPSDWTFKASNAKITLVQKDGKKVVLDPLPIKPASGRKWFTYITYNLALQGAKADVVLKDPVRVELGTLNPKSLEHPFSLVKPKIDGTQRVWSMKMKNSGEFSPFEEHQVFKAPLTATRGDDGTYVMSFPGPIPPGEYLLYTDTECWEFRVEP